MTGIAGCISTNKNTHSIVEILLKIQRHRGTFCSITDFDNAAIGLCTNNGNLNTSFITKTDKSIRYCDGFLFDVSDGIQDGMFALALKTYSKDYIELQRDRFGIKPLFVRNFPNGHAFSSEMGPLLDNNSFDNSIRFNAIAEFLGLGVILGYRTIYSNIWRVPPSSQVLLKPHSSQISKRNITNDRLTKKSLRDTMRESIVQCISSTNDIGLAISGGLDSTILAFEINDLEIDDITTISIKIDDVEDGIDNLNALNLPHNGVWESWKHHTIKFSPADLPNLIDESVKILNEPTSLTSFPLYIKLSQAANKNGVKTIIAGEGSDELFAGYPSYLNFLKFQKEKIVDPILEFEFSKEKRMWLSILMGKTYVNSCKKAFLNVYERLNQYDIKQLINVEFSLSLEPLLVRTDLCLSRKNIDIRLPFLHYGIPEFSSLLNINDLINNQTTKFFLRNEWRSLLKESIYYPKIPFRLPIAKWFSSILGDWLVDRIQSNIDYLEQLKIKKNGVYDLLNSALSGNSTSSSFIYSLLCLISWSKNNEENKILD